MKPEVMEWARQVVVRERPQPPVLEVGALNENGTARDLFPQEGYLAIDKVPGRGVMQVVDILDAGGRFSGLFNTVLATEVLEHVVEPWLAIEVMFDALRPGGLFVASWCFAFPIHAHPNDFYRVTPWGFEYLLQRVGFEQIVITTEGCGRPARTPPNEEDWQYPVNVWGTARRPT